MWDQVRNLEDRFSHDEAHLKVLEYVEIVANSAEPDHRLSAYPSLTVQKLRKKNGTYETRNLIVISQNNYKTYIQKDGFKLL